MSENAPRTVGCGLAVASSDARSASADGGRSARLDTLVALALLVAGFAATLWLPPFDDETVNDLFVYRVFTEPVLDGGLPYRDVFLEYPPLAAPAIALPGVLGSGEEAFRWLYAGWTLLLAIPVTLLCGALAARSGGSRRRALLVAAAMPFLLGTMVRTHFDLAPVALLLGGLWLVSAERTRLGLALLGAGAMTKGFPLVAAPVALAWLVGRGRRRDALEGGLALAAVVVTLAAVALALSPRGALDAVEYHSGRPIQIESTPAMTLRLLDGLGLGEVASTSSHRSDALLHPADSVVSAIFVVALLAALALLTLAAAREGPLDARKAVSRTGAGKVDPLDARRALSRTGAGKVDPLDVRRLVLAALAAVLAFATLNKVLSPQYLIWIVPLGALAFAWRLYALAGCVLAAAILTQLEFPARYFDLVAGEPFAVALVAARDVVLLAALGLCLRELVRRPAAAAARST